MNISGKLDAVRKGVMNVSPKVVIFLLAVVVGYSFLMMGVVALVLLLSGWFHLLLPWISVGLVALSLGLLILPETYILVTFIGHLLLSFYLLQEVSIWVIVISFLGFVFCGTKVRDHFRRTFSKKFFVSNSWITIVNRGEAGSNYSPISLVRSLQPSLLQIDFPTVTSELANSTISEIQGIFGQFLDANQRLTLPRYSFWKFLQKDYQVVAFDQKILTHPSDNISEVDPIHRIPIQFDMKGLFVGAIRVLPNFYGFSRDQFLLNGQEKYFDISTFADEVRGLVLPNQKDLFLLRLQLHVSQRLQEGDILVLSIEVDKWSPNYSLTL